MVNPEISVIMPAYNAEKFIDQSIESVIAQTESKWELIIIDDGSNDGSAEIIKNYTKKDPRIIYLYQENKKQGAARNLGISHSKGKFIAFLDADDLWIKEKLSIQLKCLETIEADLVFGSASFIDVSGQILNQELTQIEGKYFRGTTAIKEFITANQIPILTVLVKKESLLKVGNFDESKLLSNVEDYHLWIKLLLANHTFFSTSQCLSFYRIHPNQSTSSKIQNYLKDIILLLEILYSKEEYKTECIAKIEILLMNSIYTIEDKEDFKYFMSCYVQIKSPIAIKVISLLYAILPSYLFRRYYRYFHSKIFNTYI